MKKLSTVSSQVCFALGSSGSKWCPLCDAGTGDRIIRHVHAAMQARLLWGTRRGSKVCFDTLLGYPHSRDALEKKGGLLKMWTLKCLTQARTARIWTPCSSQANCSSPEKENSRACETAAQHRSGKRLIMVTLNRNVFPDFAIFSPLMPWPRLQHVGRQLVSQSALTDMIEYLSGVDCTAPTHTIIRLMLGQSCACRPRIFLSWLLEEGEQKVPNDAKPTCSRCIGAMSFGSVRL
jgi:hypothetical protein